MLKAYRWTAVLLGLVAAVLFTFGLFDHHAEHERNLFASSFMASLLASLLCILSRMEAVVGRIFAREAATSRALLADAVAEALADELDARRAPQPPRLTFVR